MWAVVVVISRLRLERACILGKWEVQHDSRLCLRASIIRLSLHLMCWELLSAAFHYKRIRFAYETYMRPLTICGSRSLGRLQASHSSSSVVLK